MTDFFEIDGSFGEGGGQILRSSLSLSLVTGRPLRINNIRAGRKKPGLLRQHQTAVHAAANISRAEVVGNSPGSTTLEFIPHTVVPGRYEFEIGTAGSTMLVLETILPPLMLADQPSVIRLRGGTHNPQAPPFEFFANTMRPLLTQMGPNIDARLVRHGFYPVGGGEVHMTITPVSRLKPLVLCQRGPMLDRRAQACVSKLPESIAKRELDTIARETGWASSGLESVTITDSPGPGNVVFLFLKYENMTEVFTGFGQRGVRAEAVAKTATDELTQYLEYDVPVGSFSADQLLLPCGIAAWQGNRGSTFRTLPLSGHSQTHVELLRKILGVEIEVVKEDSGAVCVRF